MKSVSGTCLWLALGATASGGSNAGLTLVRDGQPQAVIVLDAHQPTRAAQFAAYELQHLVRRITGAELPIVKDSDPFRGVPILVGASAATRQLGLPGAPLEGEEYLVQFDQGRIALLGNDSPDFGRMDYADPRTFPSLEYTYRSTTYAVYDFLEACAGVRFYGFGEEGTVFTPRPTLTVRPLSIRARPKMDAFRRPYFSHRHTSAYSARDVLLLHLRWRVNTLFGQANHSIYSLFWRYWGKALSPDLARLFIEKKPEYFAQGYAGTFAPNALRRQYPDDPDLPPQLCATHPAVVDYFAREADQVYRGQPVEGGYGNHVRRMPGQPWYYPIQEDDSSCWCRCQRCLSRFPEVPPERRYNYLHFDWINRIAEAAARLQPEIGIATLAYSDTLPYPDPRVLALRRNVSVQLCLGIQSWYHPGVYAWQHKAYKDWVTHEAHKRPLSVWVYMLCPAHDAKVIYKYDQFFPVLYPWQTGRFFREFVQDGVRGWFGEVDPAFHLLEAYVANKVSFDPTADPDQLIAEYFALYYGRAGEPMRRFYRAIEEITWDPANYPARALNRVPQASFTYGIHTEAVNWHLGTPQRMAALQRLVDQALQQAAAGVEKRRVQAFVDTIWAQAVTGRKAFEAREQVRAVPVPRVTCDYAGECDGVPARVDFQAAAPSGGWTLIDGRDLATRPELALASDSRFFYFRYHESGATAQAHRQAGLWHNNLEVFLAGQPDVPYGQLALAPSGEFEALRHQVVAGVLRTEPWSVRPIIENRLDSKGWTVAVAIPLAQLLPDRELAPGDRFYANFMRTRLFDGEKSWSWSPIFADAYAQSLNRMGVVYLAPMAGAGEVPVNGTFASATGLLPDGWVLNRGAGLDPRGSVTTAQGWVQITSAGQWVHLYHGRVVPVRRGDRIVLEFTARGTGQGAAGVYFYAGGAEGAGSRLDRIGLTPTPQSHTLTVPVANTTPGRFVAGFRPVLAASPDARAEYSRLRVRVLEREKTSLPSTAPGR